MMRQESPIEPPDCPNCGVGLYLIDHCGIEHLTLDGGVYRPLHGGEGLASEINLRCGACGFLLPQESREFFYRRWYVIKEAIQ